MTRNLVEMLRRQAEARGASTAYTFLADGERECDCVTYAALDERARAIAVALLERGIRPGDRALLLYPPGLDFIAAFFGCVYSGVIAVPAYPPLPSQVARALPRLAAVVGDAEVAVVLGTSDVAAMAEPLAGMLPAFSALPWISVDEVEAGRAGDWVAQGVGPESLAFLQYTSGSTATPKGVMVSHGNLLHNLASLAHLSAHDDTSVAVSWLPVIHDMGLIEGVLQPAFAGYPAYLLSPAAFLQRPMRWLQAITKYRATNSGGPNFAYDLCVRKATPAHLEALDLTSWRCAYNGAEPVRRETLLRFHEVFGRTGFRWRSFFPVYGLAESTLLVSSGTREDEPSFDDTLVSCGRTWLGTAVRIVDPNSHVRRGDGEVGEIWVSSPSVAQGYWRRPEQTALTFKATIVGEEGEWLRTGDLGVMRDGELFIAGRLKDLLIVRGAKHYPQDIELTVEGQHEAVRPGCCAAFALEAAGDAIGIAVEIDPRRVTGELNDVVLAIRQGVTEQHGIQLHAVSLLRPGALPKTTSGKLQRHACRAAFASGRLDELHRWSSPALQASEASLPAREFAMQSAS